MILTDWLNSYNFLLLSDRTLMFIYASFFDRIFVQSYISKHFPGSISLKVLC